MDWIEIEGRWNQITSQVKSRMGTPTADHVAVVVANPTDDAEQPGETTAKEDLGKVLSVPPH
jgi:hypothetical protein